MDKAWLVAWATTRTGLSDRAVIVGPSLAWLERADESERDALLRLIDVASDKAALTADASSAVEELLHGYGLEPPDSADCRWVILFALADGTMNLEPYALARFLGRIATPSEPGFRLLVGFLADVDDIDDGYLDAALVEQEIVDTFAERRPELIDLARERFAALVGKQWIVETLNGR